MADVEAVNALIERIRSCVSRMSRTTLTHTKVEFRRDASALHAAERDLQAAIHSAAEIGTHILGDIEVGVPEDHGQIFGILASRAVLPRDLAERLALLAALRDVPLRGVVDLDHGMLYEAIGDFEAFIAVARKSL